MYISSLSLQRGTSFVLKHQPAWWNNVWIPFFQKTQKYWWSLAVLFLNLHGNRLSLHKPSATCLAIARGFKRKTFPGPPPPATPVQTGPGAHPAFYTMPTRSFPAVKRPEHGFDHPPSSGAEVEGKVELYLYSPSGPSWPVLGWNLPPPPFNF